jgi:hypothetical protein
MLPLEQTAPELFRAAAAAYFGTEQALAAIRQRPGAIPVAVTAGQQVVWLDVGGYPFKEWKFRYSIKNLIENQGLGGCFSTDLGLLARDEVLSDTLAPTGFVFHVSKCGSTLMAKALAQAPSHIVVSEGTPLHENLWRHLTDGWRRPTVLGKAELSLLRNLILALGRRRLPEQRHYFVKFRSWTVTFLAAIQQAFPQTPCLFLYRDPAEVLVSSLNKPTTGQTRLKESGAASYITGLSPESLLAMSDLEYFTSLYEQHLRAGLLQAQEGRMAYLNYAQLTPENLPSILREAFAFVPDADDLPAMQAQFGRYAKDDSNAAGFTPDSSEKQKLITPDIRKAADARLMPWHRQLEASQANLNRVLA